MILTALEIGIGSCWLGAINRKKIREILNVPEKFAIDSILSLGYPAEDPIMEPFEDSVQYYKDQKGRLHVPKKSLEDIIHRNTF